MEDYSKEGLVAEDFIAIGIYFILNIFVGIYALCIPNRNSINGYFLAGRFMWWLPIGASLFASNIGSEHFIGLAGSGAASGIGIGAFNFNSIILLQLLGWVFIPVFIASGVKTAPEYMARRFGGQRIQRYLVVLSLILYIFTKISVDLYSGALFINQALHWDVYSSIIALLVLTAIFTTTGGLVAVIYTDTLQFFVMILGATIVMIKAFQKVGGYEALQYKYMLAIPKYRYENSTCGTPRRDSWIMLRDPVNSDLPWPAFLLGQTPASIWYWCADQVMVQRVLSARSLSHAQGGTLFAAYIKILPFFMIILPGMISRVLFPDDVACVLPEECLRACGSKVSCYNSAYPRLVVGIMPSGMKGLMLAVMLAALMSDMSSIFNSASTLFTMDIWRRIRPTAVTKELLIVGKISVVVLVGISVAWIPVIEQLQGGQLFIYIQKIGAYLSPPIACVYLMAVIWPRMNEQGAFWALMTGFFVGIIRMVLDFIYTPPACNEIDTRPVILSQVNFMYFATLLFWLTALCGLVVSFVTEPPSLDKLIRTTYQTRLDQSHLSDEHALRELKKENHPPVTAHHSSERLRHSWRRFLSVKWLCGLDMSSTEEEEPEVNRRRILASLKQGKWAKVFLNINLIIIICIGIALFAVFTIDPFPKEIDPTIVLLNDSDWS